MWWPRNGLIPVSLGMVALGLGLGLGLGWEWRGPRAPVDREKVEVVATRATPASLEQVEVLTLGVTLRNSADRIDDVTVEMSVRGEDGELVLRERQSGMALGEDATQSVYWVWRVPGRLSAGGYNVDIAVFDSETRAELARAPAATGFEVREKTGPGGPIVTGDVAR